MEASAASPTPIPARFGHPARRWPEAPTRVTGSGAGRLPWGHARHKGGSARRSLGIATGTCLQVRGQLSGRANMNVRMLLRQKGDTVWTIGPDETVFRALELLHEKNIGALLVLEGDKLVGILSERDYARKGILTGRMSKDTRVRDMMTTKVACVSPNGPSRNAWPS